MCTLEMMMISSWCPVKLHYYDDSCDDKSNYNGVDIATEGDDDDDDGGYDYAPAA